MRGQLHILWISGLTYPLGGEHDEVARAPLRFSGGLDLVGSPRVRPNSTAIRPPQ